MILLVPSYLQYVLFCEVYQKLQVMFEFRESKARSLLILSGEAWWTFIWNTVLVGHLTVTIIYLLFSSSHIYDLEMGTDMG